MSSLDLSHNEMPKASASPTGSNEDSIEVIEQKKALLEMSNMSVLRGYDMAVDLLILAGHNDAANTLVQNRGILMVGLEKSIADRY